MRGLRVKVKALENNFAAVASQLELIFLSLSLSPRLLSMKFT